MADAKARKRRLRERRQQAGMKAALVWLSPEGQAAMAALRQPGETIDAVVNRALITLQQGLANGTSPAPRPDTRLRDGAGAALVALLQPVDMSKPWRAETYAMTDTTLYYALSTIAQCAAALAALIGFFGLWQLDRLQEQREEAMQHLRVLLIRPC
jgi:hypothetical protein